MSASLSLSFFKSISVCLPVFFVSVYLFLYTCVRSYLSSTEIVEYYYTNYLSYTKSVSNVTGLCELCEKEVYANCFIILHDILGVYNCNLSFLLQLHFFHVLLFTLPFLSGHLAMSIEEQTMNYLIKNISAIFVPVGGKFAARTWNDSASVLR